MSDHDYIGRKCQIILVKNVRTNLDLFHALYAHLCVICIHSCFLLCSVYLHAYILLDAYNAKGGREIPSYYTRTGMYLYVYKSIWYE